MKIKQNDMLELSANYYYSIYDRFQPDISYITAFLHNVSVDKYTIKTFIDSLSARGNAFNHVGISKDNEKKLIYISEEMIICSDSPFTQEEENFNNLFMKFTRLELCQKSLIQCCVVTQNNFIELIIKYNDLQKQEASFILLYQDDKNWYDVLPFDTKEVMEKFVADHTK